MRLPAYTRRAMDSAAYVAANHVSLTSYAGIDSPLTVSLAHAVHGPMAVGAFICANSAVFVGSIRFLVLAPNTLSPSFYHPFLAATVRHGVFGCNTLECQNFYPI